MLILLRPGTGVSRARKWGAQYKGRYIPGKWTFAGKPNEESILVQMGICEMISASLAVEKPDTQAMLCTLKCRIHGAIQEYSNQDFPKSLHLGRLEKRQAIKFTKLLNHSFYLLPFTAWLALSSDLSHLLNIGVFSSLSFFTLFLPQKMSFSSIDLYLTSELKLIPMLPIHAKLIFIFKSHFKIFIAIVSRKRNILEILGSR